MQVAEQVAVLGGDREAAEAGGGAQRLDVGRRRAAEHGGERRRAASAPRSTVFSVKPRAPASRSYSSSSSSPSPRDSSTRAATSSRVKVELTSSWSSHAEQPQHRVGDRVDHDDDRAQHGHEGPDQRGRAPARPARARPARCSWGSSRPARRAGRPRSSSADHEGDRVQQRLRDAERVAGPARPGGPPRGSPTAPSTSEQTVMPSWLTPITSEMFSIAAQRGLGHPRAGLGARLDLAAPRRDQRELGAHEERVAEQQERRRRASAVRSLIGVASLRGVAVAVEQPQRRPGRSRRPSMCSTVSTASCSRGLVGVACGRAPAPRRCRRRRGPGRAPGAPGRRWCRSPRSRAARRR